MYLQDSISMSVVSMSAFSSESWQIWAELKASSPCKPDKPLHGLTLLFCLVITVMSNVLPRQPLSFLKS